MSTSYPKITKKRYQCPMCNDIEEVSTNHYGEMYAPCTNCRSCVRLCIEPEAIALREASHDAYMEVVPYYLDITDERDGDKYHAMCKKLKEKGYSKWAVTPSFPYAKDANSVQHQSLEANAGSSLDVYKVDQFDKQYSTNRGRIHQWLEIEYANKNLRVGYYVDSITRKGA